MTAEYDSIHTDLFAPHLPYPDLSRRVLPFQRAHIEMMTNAYFRRLNAGSNMSTFICGWLPRALHESIYNRYRNQAEDRLLQAVDEKFRDYSSPLSWLTESVRSYRRWVAAEVVFGLHKGNHQVEDAGYRASVGLMCRQVVIKAVTGEDRQVARHLEIDSGWQIAFEMQIIELDIHPAELVDVLARFVNKPPLREI